VRFLRLLAAFLLMIYGLYVLEPDAHGLQLYLGTALMGAAYLLVYQPKK